MGDNVKREVVPFALPLSSGLGGGGGGGRKGE